MGFQEMVSSFVAFNKNAFSNLVYVCSQNGWFFVLALCVLVTIILNCKEVIEVTTQEEQDIL